MNLFDLLNPKMFRPLAGRNHMLARNDPAYEAQVEDLMERILVELKANAQRRQEGKKITTELSSYPPVMCKAEFHTERSLNLERCNTTSYPTCPPGGGGLVLYPAPRRR